MIRFLCPACQKQLKAPEEGVGQKTQCPRCGQRMCIPPPVRAQPKTTTGQPEPLRLSALSEVVDEVQDAEGEPFEEKRVIRKRRTGGMGSGCLMAFGLLLCVFGPLTTLGYWLGYNTSIRTMGDPPAYQIDDSRSLPYSGLFYVHNTGLMNNRIVGTIVGLGMALGGMIVLLGLRLMERLECLLDREDDKP